MGGACCSSNPANMVDDDELKDNQEPGQNIQWTSKAKLSMMNKT